MTEQWRPVVAWEQRYEVSDKGRIRSLDMKCGARNGGIAVRKGKLLVQVTKQGRYKAVTFTDGVWRAQQLVHNTVLEAFRGPRPAGMVARHLDGDKSNNALSNLKWGTPQENADDRIAHGNSGKGEQHPGARLSDQDVQTIRETHWFSHKALAAHYGVSPEHIASIKARRCWKHI